MPIKLAFEEPRLAISIRLIQKSPVRSTRRQSQMVLSVVQLTQSAQQVSLLSACSRTAQRSPPGREWVRIRLEPARNDCDAVNCTWDYARNACVGQVAVLVHMEDRQMRGPSEAAGAINRRDQT